MVKKMIDGVIYPKITLGFEGRCIIKFSLCVVIAIYLQDNLFTPEKKTQKAPSPIGMILLSAVLGAVLWSI